MPLTRCPRCNRRQVVPPTLAGLLVNCEKCGGEFRATEVRERRTTGTPRMPAEKMDLRTLGKTVGLLAALVFGVGLVMAAIIWAVSTPKTEPTSAAKPGMAGKPQVEGPEQVVGKPQAADPERAINVSPLSLWDEYQQSALAADAKYAGKHVLLSGNVQVIQRAANGQYMIGFAILAPAALDDDEVGRLTPRELKWFREGYPPNVVCYLRPDHAQAFDSVKPGQQVKLRAKVKGAEPADAWMDMQIVLADGHPPR